MERRFSPAILPLLIASMCLSDAGWAAPKQRPRPRTDGLPPATSVVPTPPAPTTPAAVKSDPISEERARTQAYVDHINADQMRPTDSQLSLGETLDPQLRAMESEPTRGAGGAPKATARRLDTTSLEQLLGSLKNTERPTPRRMARREPPAPGQNEATLLTPDFSRQKSSFAVLLGRDIVTLPVAGTPASESLQPDGGVADAWSLVDIVAEGLEFSPALRQAGAQRETARERTRQARADLLPTLSTRIATGQARSTTDGTSPVSTGQYQTSITRLVQPIYNHTLINNFGSANAAERAAAARLLAARESVALSIVQATVNLASSRISVEFSEELEGNLTEILRYLEDRARTGVASASDLERARTRVLAAKQQIIDQQASYRSALFEVERLLGTVPRNLRLPYLNQLPQLPQTQAELRALVLSRNADLQALKADVEAQRALVEAQFGRMLPALSLSAERDTQSNVQGPTPMQRDTRLLAVLTWSVSLGGKEVFGGREATAELNVRTAKYEDERRRIEQTVESDFTQLVSATQRVPAGEAEQRSALEVVKAVREQLKIGRMGTLLEALDAFDRLYAARVRYGQSLAQQMIAQAQLLQRMNGLSAMAAAAPDPNAAAPGGATDEAR